MSSNTPLTDSEISQLSDTLFSARSQKQVLESYPGKVPSTLEEAYQVQDLSIKKATEQIVGWKIGMVPPELREQMQSERIMGPIFSNVYHYVGKAHQDGEKVDLPVFDGGFIAIEAELVLEIAQDITPGSVDTSQGVEHLVKNVYTGIEIASSAVPDLNSYGPAAIISDFGNNYGMVVGNPIEDWQNVIARTQTSLYIDGELINQAPTNGVLNGPMAALAFLIDCSAKRGITLPAGTFVCSGAITGVHETLVGAKSTADFAEAGKINLELVSL
ncbi:hypothetical protein C2869_01815 [Saccharobesus litoralis]|uniref:2-keto-4-pentenoate hydratase n=1 Tax=Saccharobesus litoralis TaxID=2172099 RepID=A0A2S0VM26_9ALTE|nr:hypothetical protein [Saccharobesus litoralis]AWB65258.1 hypothetical protein C2869_01815 [Saccharobesus litoralis]